MRGNFVWHELMTTDTQSASSFYPRVTGWKTRPWEHDSSYTLFEGAGGSPMGGLMKLPDDAKSMGAPPSWLPYIGSTDIAGTIAHAQRLGGRVLKDVQDIPNIGKFAVLADPQGAAFAVLQSSQPAPAGTGRPGVGDFSWHELATSDHRAAFEFYGDLFGWRKGAGHDMGPMGIYQIFSIGGKEAGGMFNKDPNVPAHWLSYVNVSDADAAARAASAAGGKIINGPMDVPGGDRIAQIRDPQGGAFAVHSYPKPVAKPVSQTSLSQPRPSQPSAAAKPAASATSGSTAAAPAKSAAPKKARKAAKRQSPARKAASARKRAASARKRGSRKTARRAKSARKSARRGSARRASPKRRASARRKK